MSRRPSASSWVSPKAAALPAPSLARRRLGPTRPTRTLRLSRRRRSRPWASAILKKWPHESACAIKRRLGQIFNAANDAVGQALSKTSLAGLAKFGRNCNRHEHVQSKGVTTMGRLAGKNILITGGNSGIGLAAAQEFEREGARVAICGLNERSLQVAKKTLGAGSLAVRADVSNLTDLDTMFATIKREFGHLDGVLVNAGYSVFLPFEEVTEQNFDKVISIDFKGVYFTIQKALPLR